MNHPNTNPSSGEEPAGGTFSFGTLPTMPNMTTPNFSNNNANYPMYPLPQNYPPYPSYNNSSPHSPQATPQFNWTPQQKLMEQVESMTCLGNSLQESNVSLMKELSVARNMISVSSQCILELEKDLAASESNRESVKRELKVLKETCDDLTERLNKASSQSTSSNGNRFTPYPGNPNWK